MRLRRGRTTLSHGGMPSEPSVTRMAEAAKKHKVSEPTIYAWRKHFGQLDVADVKRLKAVELENSRLEKLLAEATLDNAILKEINAKNGEPPGSTCPGCWRPVYQPTASAQGPHGHNDLRRDVARPGSRGRAAAQQSWPRSFEHGVGVR